MPRVLRWLNALGHAVTLASALLVLGSNLLDPSYGRFYGDSLPLVLAYVAVQAWCLLVFALAWPALPAVAAAKGLIAWMFVGPLLLALAAPEELPHWPRVAVLAEVARDWMRVTPARYVYQLFDWGPDAQIGLLGFVFLGRGAFVTLTAFVATEGWWRPLRTTRPLLGRLVTLVPVTLMVAAMWAFLQSVRVHERTWSPEAQDVAQVVLEGLDCDTIRARSGQTTSDVRQRGSARYDVTITYGCRETRVMVRAGDGRVGIAAGPRPECCGTGARRSGGGGPGA